MKNLNFLILIIVMISHGCTFYSVKAQELAINSANMQNHSAQEIPYLENPNFEYEVIGHVNVNTERRNSKEEVLDKMRRQIAVTGGDAIINLTQNDPPSAIQHVRTNYCATIIRHKK